MFKHGFRDDGIKSVILEGQEMPISDDVDFRGRFNFEIDDVRSVSAVAGTEIQYVRVRTELTD